MTTYCRLQSLVRDMHKKRLNSSLLHMQITTRTVTTSNTEVSRSNILEQKSLDWGIIETLTRSIWTTWLLGLDYIKMVSLVWWLTPAIGRLKDIPSPQSTTFGRLPSKAERWFNGQNIHHRKPHYWMARIFHVRILLVSNERPGKSEYDVLSVMLT